MIKVKLKQPRAGIDEQGRVFSQDAGDIVDMTEEEAARYVERNYAEYLEGVPPIQTASAAGERVESGSVTADTPQQPAKRRRGRPRKSERSEVAGSASG